ncbi:hypothetical protein JTE90_019826 [Oedothorax gibbosus]|uniref:C2H2-type domain-containing protein n=1 Tax=Oedothorax gibbosus TaxID=931172 RepID=A0AAV6V5J5_9ARAC|nr:hypothetical protein JTE90_019826 [Oedothorax gibbosus]
MAPMAVGSSNIKLNPGVAESEKPASTSKSRLFLTFQLPSKQGSRKGSEKALIRGSPICVELPPASAKKTIGTAPKLGELTRVDSSTNSRETDHVDTTTEFEKSDDAIITSISGKTALEDPVSGNAGTAKKDRGQVSAGPIIVDLLSESKKSGHLDANLTSGVAPKVEVLPGSEPDVPAIHQSNPVATKPATQQRFRIYRVPLNQIFGPNAKMPILSGGPVHVGPTSATGGTTNFQLAPVAGSTGPINLTAVADGRAYIGIAPGSGGSPNIQLAPLGGMPSTIGPVSLSGGPSNIDLTPLSERPSSILLDSKSDRSSVMGFDPKSEGSSSMGRKPVSQNRGKVSCKCSTCQNTYSNKDAFYYHIKNCFNDSEKESEKVPVPEGPATINLISGAANSNLVVPGPPVPFSTPTVEKQALQTQLLSRGSDCTVPDTWSGGISGLQDPNSMYGGLAPVDSGSITERSSDPSLNLVPGEILAVAPEKPPKISYPRKCSNCQNTYRNKSAFQYHKAKCSQEKTEASYPRKCSHCGTVFLTRYSYFKHLKNESRPKQKSIYPRKCLLCGKTYTSREAFWKHKKRNCYTVKHSPKPAEVSMSEGSSMVSGTMSEGSANTISLSENQRMPAALLPDNVANKQPQKRRLFLMYIPPTEHTYAASKPTPGPTLVRLTPIPEITAYEDPTPGTRRKVEEDVTQVAANTDRTLVSGGKVNENLTPVACMKSQEDLSLVTGVTTHKDLLVDGEKVSEDVIVSGENVSCSLSEDLSCIDRDLVFGSPTASVSGEQKGIKPGKPKVFYPRMCPLCQKSYRNKNAFQYHKLNCVGVNAAKNTSGVAVNAVENTSNFYKKCLRCLNSYSSKSAYYYHMKKCPPPQTQKPVYPRTCLVCSKSYKTRSSFCGHKKTCSSEKCAPKPKKLKPKASRLKVTEHASISGESSSTDMLTSSVGPSNMDSMLKSGEASLGVEGTNTGKRVKYPRQCPKCKKSFLKQDHFMYHLNKSVECKAMYYVLIGKDLANPNKKTPSEKPASPRKTRLFLTFQMPSKKGSGKGSKPALLCGSPICIELPIARTKKTIGPAPKPGESTHVDSSTKSEDTDQTDTATESEGSADATITSISGKTALEDQISGNAKKDPDQVSGGPIIVDLNSECEKSGHLDANRTPGVALKVEVLPDPVPVNLPESEVPAVHESNPVAKNPAPQQRFRIYRVPLNQIFDPNASMPVLSGGPVQVGLSSATGGTTNIQLAPVAGSTGPINLTAVADGRAYIGIAPGSRGSQNIQLAPLGGIPFNIGQFIVPGGPSNIGPLMVPGGLPNIQLASLGRMPSNTGPVIVPGGPSNIGPLSLPVASPNIHLAPLGGLPSNIGQVIVSAGPSTIGPVSLSGGPSNIDPTPVSEEPSSMGPDPKTEESSSMGFDPKSEGSSSMGLKPVSQNRGKVSWKCSTCQNSYSNKDAFYYHIKSCYFKDSEKETSTSITLAQRQIKKPTFKNSKHVYPKKCLCCGKMLHRTALFRHKRLKRCKPNPESSCEQMNPEPETIKLHHKPSLEFNQAPLMPSRPTGKISYPRKCIHCGREYAHKTSFGRHRRKCGSMRERHAGPSATTDKPENQSGKRIKYPRFCHSCKKYFRNLDSFMYHLKKSAECKAIHYFILGKDLVNPKKSIYPRKCLFCDKIFHNPSLYSLHRKSCGTVTTS